MAARGSDEPDHKTQCKDPKMAQERLRVAPQGPKRDPRWIQENFHWAPRGPQEGGDSRCQNRCFDSASSLVAKSPRRAPGGPLRGPQSGPRESQMGPKMDPRELPVGAKRALEGGGSRCQNRCFVSASSLVAKSPRRDPRGPQEGPRVAPERSKRAPRKIQEGHNARRSSLVAPL